MRGVRPSLAGGLLAVVMLVGGSAAAATPAPTPEPTPTATPTVVPVPEPVAAWFTGPGLEAAQQSAIGAETEALIVGRPRQVALWSDGYIAGDPAAEPTQPLEEWVAPVTAPPAEEGERVPVGVVWAGSENGAAPELIEILEDPDLAAGLARHEGELTVVRDTGVDGWFALAEGEVWPLSENARSVLQGSLAVDVFQAFVHRRLGEPTASPVPLPEVEEDGAMSPLVPIAAIVVLGAGSAWLLVRQYRRDDSRIAADVRAGVSPPRHEEP